MDRRDVAQQAFQQPGELHRWSLPPGEVLVTGGAGFLGSHLVEHLLGRGHRVHVVDDLSSGSLENLAGVATHARLRVTVGSIADAALAATACGEAAAVFHLAGVVGVQRLCREPVEVMRGNVQATEVVLAAAARCRVPTLITSSSEVYGDGPVPFRETDPVRPGVPSGGRGGYACAKALGEWLALAHAGASGLPVVVARLFNTVGPRQSSAQGMVLPRFLEQARSGQALTVFGDGSQTRCFAAVDEVVEALVGLLATPAARSLLINVGSDREITVQRLAEVVVGAVGGGSIEHVPHERVFPRGFADPRRRVPCLQRLRALLGRAPSRSIEAIVADLALQSAGRCVGAVAAQARA